MCMGFACANMKGLQTVIPGFDYSDHDFLTSEKFAGLVTEEQKEELEWLVRKE
jgi:hypothetical protein